MTLLEFLWVKKQNRIHFWYAKQELEPTEVKASAFIHQSNTNTSSPKSRAGKEGGGKKDKKKNQQAKDKKTVSLQDFQAESSAGETSLLLL